MGRKLLLGLLLLAPLGFYPLLRDSKAHSHVEYVPPAPSPLTDEQKFVVQGVCMPPGQSFPACVPWVQMRAIAESQPDERRELLKQEPPIMFLEHCLERYKKDVQGYRCVFEKREVVKGVERENEIILAHFREQPFSVLMEWKEGVDLCFASLYVEGENKGELLARSRVPFIGSRGPIFQRPVDAPDVKTTSRFGIDKFGVYLGQKNTYDAIIEAKNEGTLHLKYTGTEHVKKLGNRLCYKFVRTPYVPPEEAEGLNELIFYIDCATLLQTGSELKDDKGKFIAEYFFRDIELNPVFDEAQFTRKKL